MKRILFAAILGCAIITAFFFTGCNGCKEIGPNVNLTPPVDGFTITDSTWKLSATAIGALTTDAHNVLIEEFTGQTCSNCPAAHTLLDGIAGQYAAGRVNIASMYYTGGPQTNPPSGFVYDLRDPDATQITNSIYGSVGALPSGGVDRTINPSPSLGGPLLYSSADWAGVIATQVNVPDSININVTSSYNSTDSLVTTTATVTYTKPVSTKQKIAFVVVEDSLVDLQEFPDSVHSGYHFSAVMRGMEALSIPSGDPMLDSIANKEIGRVFRRVITYKLKSVTPAIKPANCRVIAFVTANNNTDVHVMQSAQTKLTGQ
jgi:outer membrane protein Omp28